MSSLTEISFLQPSLSLTHNTHTHTHINQRGTLETAIDAGPPVGSENALVIMVFFICLGVTVALTILGGWHMYLISVSETTIEFYLNKRDARRLKKEGKVCVCIYICTVVLYCTHTLHKQKFHNPYSYGFFNNWIFFLGLVNGRYISIVGSPLLPSPNAPPLYTPPHVSSAQIPSS